MDSEVFEADEINSMVIKEAMEKIKANKTDPSLLLVTLFPIVKDKLADLCSSKNY